MKTLTVRILAILFLLVGALSASAQSYCLESAIGYASGVTGGAGKTVKTITNQSELATALKNGNGIYIITTSFNVTSVVKGTGSNYTLLAMPGVKLTGTLRDKSAGIFNLSGGSNIILRNLTLVGAGAYDCDASTGDDITLQGAKNVWIDHCDISDGVDGNLDIKSKSDNITVSWCKFHYDKAPKAGGSGGTDDHRFNGLIGSSSSDKPEDGTYNVSFIANWWADGCVERMPRCRNCLVQCVNDYWGSKDANYYIGPENANVYCEACYFDNRSSKIKQSTIVKSYGGTNKVQFKNCESPVGLPTSTTVSATASLGSYEILTASAAKTAVTDATCGAGATLSVNVSTGEVSSACDAAITLELTTAVGTDAQTVIRGHAIEQIKYTAGGDATNINVTGLPSGVTFSKSGLVATITGTPTAAGPYTYTVTASDGSGNQRTMTGTITVENPVMANLTISPSTVTVEQGKEMTSIVVTADHAVNTWNFSSLLPTGITYATTSTTLTISGTADLLATIKNYPLSITATNDAGTSSAVVGTITVVEPSKCTLYLWFFNEDDATAAGVTNSSRLTVTEEGNSSKSGSITIDGNTYNTTKRSGNNTTHSLSFTVNTGYRGTLYGIVNSSSSSTRTIQLLKNGAPYTTFSVSGSDMQGLTLASNLPAGTYTLGTQDGNWGLAFYAFKECLDLCDAQTLTLNPSSTTALVDENVTITPTKSGTGDITYTIQKGGAVTTDATITANVFTATKTGTYTISATIERDDDYCEATSDEITITVSCVPQALSIGASSTNVEKNTNVTITPTKTGTGTITYGVTDGDDNATANASITNKGVFSATADGAYKVTASIAADTKYCAAVATPINMTVLTKPSVSVNSASQTVETGASIVNIVFTATGGAVSSWSDITASLPTGLTAVESLDKSTLTISGTVNTSALQKVYAITATATNAAGNGSASTSITVTCKSQTISISATSPIKVSQTTTVNTIKTGTGDVNYYLNTTTGASISGNVVTGLQIGTYSVYATIAADAIYCAATSNTINIVVEDDPTPTIETTPTSQSINLTDAITDITFTSTEAGTFDYGVLPTGLTASVSANNKVLTISGTPTEAGTLTISVSVTGSSTGKTSNVYTSTISVGSVTPKLTLSADDKTILTGANATLTATATAFNNSVSSIVLKEGETTLTTINAESGNYVYTATSDGAHIITAILTDAAGKTATANITITASAPTPPTATLTSNASAVNLGGSFNLTATGYLTTGTSITDVIIRNGGATLNSGSTNPLVYVWTPTAPGSYTLSATVTDDQTLTGTSTNLVLTVNPNKPVLSTPTSTDVKRGVAMTPVVITADSACTWNVTSLPDGITYAVSGDRHSITISGTPSGSATLGATNYIVTATADCGTHASVSGTIAISAADKATLTVSPSSTITATINKAATTTTVTADADVTFNVAEINAALPTGMNATATNARTLTISGTPSTSGTYTLSVSATNASSQVTATTVKVVVNKTDVIALSCDLINSLTCPVSGNTVVTIETLDGTVVKTIYRGTPTTDTLSLIYQVNDIGTGTFNVKVNGVTKQTIAVE